MKNPFYESFNAHTLVIMKYLINEKFIYIYIQSKIMLETSDLYAHAIVIYLAEGYTLHKAMVYVLQYLQLFYLICF